ncbi:MAG: antitoxin [bacterium]|nr:antitoxin [bacterium]
MTKTQIQIPDEMYQQAKRLASAQEWSLAELCRRGIEYMLSVYPLHPTQASDWCFPEPIDLGDADPFTDPDWRLQYSQRTDGEMLSTSSARET